jgi:hypothetical protein
VRGKHFRAGVARAARKRMRGRDSRFQSFIPVAQHQPRRWSPCTATSPVIESTFCGFLIPEESDCMPSILELHAVWEAIFVDDVNIWDTAGRSAQPEKSCPIRGSAFMRLWFLRPSKTSWNRFPGLVPEIPCTSCMCLDIANQDAVSCGKCLQSMALKQTSSPAAPHGLWWRCVLVQCGSRIALMSSTFFGASIHISLPSLVRLLYVKDLWFSEAGDMIRPQN